MGELGLAIKNQFKSRSEAIKSFQAFFIFEVAVADADLQFGLNVLNSKLPLRTD